jgi:hypothetical protein
VQVLIAGAEAVEGFHAAHPEVVGVDAMAVSHGMARVFETARMYTKGEPQVPFHRWVGVTTFELG